MRQALATALLLAVATLEGACAWWVPLVPLVVRLVWDGSGFVRTQVIPLFTDD
jgi:hypothetical protein